MHARKHLLTALTAIALAACADDANENRVVGELASDRVELTAEVAEPIVRIEVAEGAAVRTGDVLLQQNTDRAIEKLREAEAALAQASARVDELVRGPRAEQIRAARANVDGGEREVTFRTAEYERAKQVHAKKLASPEALDRARANLDAATANLDLRRAQLEELLAGTTVEELAQAEHAVVQAEARRDAAAVDLDRHTIRAPADGIADSRLFEVGERPAPGQPVMIFLSGEQSYARVFVPENLRVHIRPGTRASIFVDGLGSPLAGSVRWVATEAAFTPYYALTERDRGRLSYMAKVDFAETGERLPDGVPVEVEFHIDGVP